MKWSLSMIFGSTLLAFSFASPGFTGMADKQLVEVEARPDAPYRLELQLEGAPQSKPKRFLDILEGTLEEIAGPQSWSSPLPKATSKHRMAQLLDHPEPELLSRVEMDRALPGSAQSYVSNYIFALDVLVGQLHRVQENAQAVESARRFALTEQDTLLRFTEFTDRDLAELHNLFDLPQFTIALELPEVRPDSDPIEG